MFRRLRKALTSSGSSSSVLGAANAHLDDILDKFILNKSTLHGFPPNPTCMTCDTTWQLLFIGTQSGQIYMYGTPGLEQKTEHPNFPFTTSPIQFLFTISAKMTLISVCENNTMYIWSIVNDNNVAEFELATSKELIPGRGKEITACCIKDDTMFFGTGDGRFYELNLITMSTTLIDWEQGESKPIVALEICPTDSEYLLCGYKSGQITLRNICKDVQVYSVQRHDIKEEWSSCDLTCASWHPNGDGFCGFYSNGEIAYWTVSNKGTPDYVNRFFTSEYSLEPITKPIWTSNNLLIFCGGIPEDQASSPTLTLAQAIETDELELTSPILSPEPVDIDLDTDNTENSNNNNNDNSCTVNTEVIMPESHINSNSTAIENGNVSTSEFLTPSKCKPEKHISVNESLLNSSPKHTKLKFGHGPDCGDDTLEMLANLGIKTDSEDHIIDAELDMITINNVHMIREYSSSKATPNQGDAINGNDTFMTACDDSLDTSKNDISKVAQLDSILELKARQESEKKRHTLPAKFEYRFDNEKSNGITDALLSIGDFTLDEHKYTHNTDNNDPNDPKSKCSSGYKKSHSAQDLAELDENISDLEMFDIDIMNWRASGIHQMPVTPKQAELDQVMDSISQLVARPWVKKQNPWKKCEKQVLKFTSPIKGSFLIKQEQFTGKWFHSHTLSDYTTREVLGILLDQEIVFIDVTPQLECSSIQPPYLLNIHSSNMTSSILMDNLASVDYKLIRQLGIPQIAKMYPANEIDWPFNGGIVKDVCNGDYTVIFITGHENGTIKFWDVSRGSMHLLYIISTNHMFDLGADRNSTCLGASTGNGEIKSEARGFWDPYVEDHRLRITCLDCYDELLVIGGAGGQVIIFKLTKMVSPQSVFQLEAELLNGDKRYRQRPVLPPLIFKPCHEANNGYVPFMYIQISPASPITALKMAPSFSLLAVGTSYGLAVIDVEKKSVVFTHSTFTEGPVIEDNSLNRRHSVRQSFRQSFRNLRRASSGRRTGASFRGRGSTRGSGPARALSNPIMQGGVAGTGVTGQRVVIKCLTFTTTFLSGSNAQLSLWAGTSEGSVLRMAISVPSKANRRHRSTEVSLYAKPLYLRSRTSPINKITVLDANYQIQMPIGARSIKGHHTLIIVSDNQIKISNLPGLKKKYKDRIRLGESNDKKIVKADILNVNGQTCIAILDNDGLITIYSLPDLRQMFSEKLLDPADITGQKSLCMTQSGHIIVQSSQLQFQKFTLTDFIRYESTAYLGDPLSAATSPTTLNSSSVFTNKSHKSSIFDESNHEENVNVNGSAPMQRLL